MLLQRIRPGNTGRFFWIDIYSMICSRLVWPSNFWRYTAVETGLQRYKCLKTIALIDKYRCCAILWQMKR